MMANRLSLNTSKSVSMLIGSRQKLQNQKWSVFIGGSLLVNLSVVRYLGVYVDQYLCWKDHLQFVLNKVRSKLFSINRLQPFPSKVKTLLYKTFILPVIDYCDVVYSAGLSKTNDTLEHLHRRFIISQSLSTRRHFHLVTQVFRAVNHLSPPYLWHSFQLAKEVTGRLNTIGMTIICISHLSGLTMGKIVFTTEEQ